jgi:hypothetical protein
MSSLTTADLNEVAKLVDYLRGPGYVLDFSDRDFSQFFAREVQVDIDDPRYAVDGRSKGKRLRKFLEVSDNKSAVRTLKAIWNARVVLLRDVADPVADAEARYRALLSRLGASSSSPSSQAAPSLASYDLLKSQLIALTSLAPHQRGYAFQKFLNSLFDFQGADPRPPFRNTGEEIDGSFSLEGNVYLLEAKWEAKQTGVAALRAFEGKLTNNSPWGRGLFVSYAGFSQEGLVAFGRAKRTLCMDGLDLSDMLDRRLSLAEVLRAKVRRAVETGSPFVRIRDVL